MLGAELARLRSLEGAKWTAEPDDVLAAWVADMDFDQAPAIKRAISEVVDRGDLGYHFAPVRELIPAWADWQEEHFGWRPPEDECRTYTGSLHAMEVVLEFMTDAGDGVVVFTPIYHPFRNAINDSGRRLVDVPLDAPGYRLDPDRFEAALDADTKLVLFCQPHNPLGRIFDRDELVAFGEVVERHDLLVVSDEIWCDLTFENDHLPLYRELESIRDRIITLGAASKSFNIAGLRTAVAHIGSQAVRDRLDLLPSHFTGGPSSLGAVATLAAWRESGSWLDKVRAQLRLNRDHLAARLAELPGVTMQPPEATYLAWLDFSASTIADDPTGHLYDIGRIGLNAGPKFCPRATSFTRFNFATSPEILDQLIDRIDHTLQETAS